MCEVRRNLALNCWPWVRSLTHSPEAVIHSHAAMVAEWPTTVTTSRWPRALARSTQKPFSALSPHFCAGVFCNEHPFDTGACSISLLFHFAAQSLGIVDPASEALSPQGADLDLNHVDPACVLGCVVELDPPQDLPGFGGRERLIQGAGGDGRSAAVSFAQRRIGARRGACPA